MDLWTAPLAPLFFCGVDQMRQTRQGQRVALRAETCTLEICTSMIGGSKVFKASTRSGRIHRSDIGHLRHRRWTCSWHH